MDNIEYALPEAALGNLLGLGLLVAGGWGRHARRPPSG